jgi:hypothetical protein
MRIFLLATCALFFLTTQLNAQCSDAGICTIGSGGGHQEHRVGARYLLGKSGKEDDLTFHTFEVEGRISLFENSGITLILPWSSISGPLGSTTGIGDLILLWDQRLIAESGGGLSAQLGAKLATGVSNGDNLPQAYQPGLGTNDVLLGASYETDPWVFAIGYQISRGRSDNAITRLKRGDDLLGRVGYKTALESVGLSLEMLAIKRLQLSSVRDTSASDPETFVDVPESDQFQLNALASMQWAFAGRFNLRAFAAIPLLKREVNVDGLTRSVTLSIGVEAAL